MSRDITMRRIGAGGGARTGAGKRTGAGAWGEAGVGAGAVKK